MATAPNTEALNTFLIANFNNRQHPFFQKRVPLADIETITSAGARSTAVLNYAAMIGLRSCLGLLVNSIFPGFSGYDLTEQQPHLVYTAGYDLFGIDLNPAATEPYEFQGLDSNAHNLKGFPVAAFPIDQEIMDLLRVNELTKLVAAGYNIKMTQFATETLRNRPKDGNTLQSRIARMAGNMLATKSFEKSPELALDILGRLQGLN